MAGVLGNRGSWQRRTVAARAKGGLLVLGGFVALLFAIELFNMLMLRSLNSTFGLRPRSADGLLDIFTFPLLHANLNHLLSNSLPLIIFGFFSFLLVRGFFNRSWLQILLAAVLFLGYGGILLGVLPLVAGLVSWQAHLGGAAGGVVAALLLRPRRDGSPAPS